MAIRLGLSNGRDAKREDWSATETALLRNIMRSLAALVDRHGRTRRVIANKIERERERQAFTDAVSAAVKSACAALDPSVRADVEGEVLIGVLSKAVPLDRIGEAIRAARTKIYGPRHYSLNAPISDGSLTWLDTVASDREHF